MKRLLCVAFSSAMSEVFFQQKNDAYWQKAPEARVKLQMGLKGAVG